MRMCSTAQQSAISNIMRLQFDETDMHDIAIMRLQFGYPMWQSRRKTGGGPQVLGLHSELSTK